MACQGDIFSLNIANDSLYTVTATTEATTFELENALDSVVKNTFRSTSQLAQYYTFDGSAAIRIAGCAIMNCNIASGDTLQLQTSDNDFAATQETEDFTLVSRTVWEKNQTTKIFENVTYTDAYVLLNANRQDYRIYANRAAGTYVEYGKIYLFMTHTALTSSYQRGANEGVDNMFTSNRGDYGSISEDFRFQSRSYSFNFPAVNDAQSQTLSGQVGANDFIVWCPTGIGNEMYFGNMRFTVPQLIHHNPTTKANVYSIAGTFSEAL